MDTSEQARATVNERTSLSGWLASALILLVLMFDMISLFLPQFAGAELLPGGVISIGIVFAFFIVVTVVITAVYYVRRLNREDTIRQSSVVVPDR